MLCKNDIVLLPLLSFAYFMSSCLQTFAHSQWQANKDTNQVERGFYARLLQAAKSVVEDHWCSSTCCSTRNTSTAANVQTHRHTDTQARTQLVLYVLPTQQNRSLRVKGLCARECVTTVHLVFGWVRLLCHHLQVHSQSLFVVLWASEKSLSANKCRLWLVTSSLCCKLTQSGKWLEKQGVANLKKQKKQSSVSNTVKTP